MNPTDQAQGTAPVLTGTHDLASQPGAPGTYATPSDVPITGESTLLVEFSLHGFPLEEYCRFARPRADGLRRTFTSFEFSKNPPGTRVGPWPGWRGIPDLPRLNAAHGAVKTGLQMMFWGDEFSTRRVRGVARLEGAGNGRISVTTPDPRLVPERVSVYRTRAIRARTQSLTLRPDLVGLHPRLLVTPGDLPNLRAKRTGGGAAAWEKIVELLEVWDRPFEITAESKVTGDEERLSPEDRLLVSAFLSMVEPEEEYVRRGKHAYREYIEKTRRPDFEPLRIDTQSGEVLFLLCCGYDWMFSQLTSTEKVDAARRIREVAKTCGAFLTEERRDYGQAHYLGCGLGLLAYALLFHEEDPDARAWAGRLRGALECALALLPPDGSYAHGANLWIYEFGFLLRWIELLRAATGEDLWKTTPELHHASAFRSWTLSPDGMLGLAFGDPQYRVGGDCWCHALIATRTRAATSQWLAGALRDVPRDGVDFRSVPARRRVYEFLYSDPDLPEQKPAGGLRYFADTGQLTVRSGGTVFSIRSGPPLGSHRYGLGEYGGYGHADPCNGAFLLYRNGRFIASGPGPVYRRDTALHNVVTVNGEGQLGDSTVWLPDFIPPEVIAPAPLVREEPGGVALSVEISPAYLPHLGVTSWRRSLYVAIDAFVLGVDTVACDRSRSLQWNTHSWEPFLPVSGSKEPEYLLGRDVRLILIAPENLVCETGLTEFVPAYPNDGRRDHFLRAWIDGTMTRVIWCYLFSADNRPRLLQGSGPEFRLEFAGGRTVRFDGEWLVGGGAE